MKRINWPDQILNFVGVIFGVLLAFYFNGLSESIKEGKEKKAIVQSLIKDLDQDYQQFSYHIPEQETQLQALGSLVQGIQTKNQDTIITYFESLISMNNYSPTDATYQSVKSTGKLDLIESDSLKFDISFYYTNLAVEAEAKIEVQVDYFMDEILKWVTDHIDLQNPDISVLMEDPFFTNKLFIYQSFINGKINQYRLLHEMIPDLKKGLEGEL